ncbi:MAG: helix-turn-helix domain-containing protein [Candidatus Omnitrophica bacterium]|nr:helix-turn-helix domain-containing protein [Candidatus Omnitrophota bacterium]
MPGLKLEEEVLTTEEVCKFLRISRQTLYKLIERGKIPGMKVGQGYKFLKSDLISSFRRSG